MSKQKAIIYIIIIMFSFFNKTMSNNTETFFDLNVNSINGDVLNLSKLKGKTILLVNVASNCGFTKQYEDLQNLYDSYKNKGLIVIGMPSNQFGGQEPDSETEIKKFCETNFNITFPMTSKYEVKGDNAHPIYIWAKDTYGKSTVPKWNFHKILINKEGKFVAETPGVFTVIAQSGGYSARKTIEVVQRNVKKEVKVVGHGTVDGVNTSDLWVWPGVGKHKGKDFAATGTWGANGEAYFWDVTEPENMYIIDTVTVDARTVNDVKVSENGEVAVITREGASNRKNGFVVLDIRDPFNVKITAEYNDDMTGGVHNVFIYENHVYAVNNGRKYDVINIEDPSNPFRVGRYELDTPGHGVHDVWVIDGLAYSSNWADGVHVVDVGGVKFNEKNRSKVQYNPFLAMAGQGSPGNPVKLGGMSDPNGHNHAAFPFISQSSDKFYLITGDEYGDQFGMAGGFHFLDFTDPSDPKETAVYQVPEAGSHNHWVHGDTLLASYYQGGLRVVDISGELMGDIYAQGREIAFFMSSDPKGFIANRPNVWGTMPYKGLIYFSDMNNGLWAIKLEDQKRMGTN